MKKFGLLITLILTLVLAACGQNNDSGNGEAEEGKKVLTMGTSADFAPFESRNTSGEVEGFDIDLAKYIAEKLGYELKIEDMKFDGLIGALQAKRVDLVLSGMSATEKRAQNVDFSTQYHHSGEMFITLKDSEVTSLEQLKGKTVGVQLGTIQEEGARKLQETVDFEIKAVDNATILIQELQSNRIDVAYLDKSVARGYINEQGLAGFDDPTSSSPGMAVAFPKGSELVDEVNQVLKEMEENGKLDELKAKWLSEE
ncbi:transporter substrate-binding domain-containing protein [Robertmurraya korlensis]|uniref:transporter substrate-binding domain-containing protein n=1 Tax=Robertmurraya korlensis TaxID=519977 RepID=UPI0020402495|nr:transporter substrate-binding domain-containing protein [Robertmurraya korlensis]MCM3601886.1 transporter substrate-binding domain-containing protein [Robertmurraya korlensis]